MYAKVIVLALFSCCASAYPLFLRFEDDGQWRPESDGSYWGRGDIQWSLEDGSWKPELDGSYLGDGSLSWLDRRRRSIALSNPNALPVPLDEPITAYAKNAHLIQQRTEGTRNILGGGIPINLPADTYEVAVGKQAHAIAHAKQSAITTGLNENFPINIGLPSLQPWYAQPWALDFPHPYDSRYY
ncbi:Hypothetical protein NTJ_09736 [Nesidiocoris tenuis]|uniref:Uncharacterized protein n=1 Tax=Nesidiocoris tenuis TaxID=355587 RepID=A0ABN7B2E7_9HEMI|nr:Hypothetical protein NTJ_09736 [Nesidiocoris tenuis]